MAGALRATALQNDFIDDHQNKCFNDAYLEMLRDWIAMDLGGSRLVDYMLEKAAYELVTMGLATFLLLARPAEKDLSDSYDPNLTEEDMVSLMKHMSDKIEDAYRHKANGTLEDPAKRRDCKWHEHTEEDRKKCSRY
jgi:hypothetical protein